MPTSNLSRLFAHKMSMVLMPPGSASIDNAIEALRDPARMKAASHEALHWVNEAIRVVRLAADPNPFKHASDEAIAAEIMRKVDENVEAQKRAASASRHALHH